MKFCAVPVCNETKSIINFKHVFNLYKEKFEDNDMFLGIMGLTENELFVLDMRFHDNGEVSLSRPKIASFLEVCSERVRQIEKKALFKLEKPSRSEKMKNFLKEEEGGDQHEATRQSIFKSGFRGGLRNL